MSMRSSSQIVERNVLFRRSYQNGTIRSAIVARMVPTDGRRAQAAQNDERILTAARAVFVGDPGAPIAAVAKEAGVGIGALYRRYPSKEGLLRALCADGLERYIAAVEAALAAHGDAWEAFEGFMRAAV